MFTVFARRGRRRNCSPTDVELDELRAKVAHELFTPLANVVGYIEFICEGDAGPLSDEQQSLLEVVARNSRRLTGILQNLLEMTTIDPAMIIGYLARKDRPTEIREAGQPQPT